MKRIDVFERMQQKTREAGFTLVELMIALVLGLLVIAGVGSVFIANKDAYRTNEALSQVQDASRTGFEFLAREIREAGANPCGSVSVASILKSSGDDMIDDMSSLEGWDDASSVADLPSSGNGAAVAGESAIRISGAKDSGLSLEPQDSARANISLATADELGRIEDGDVLMVCDADKATVFQVSNFNGQNPIVINSGTGTPGNRTKCLNHPVPLNKPPGFECTQLSPTSYLAVPTNYIWYIGTNEDGVRGLYRYGRSKNVASETTEMVRGVEGMQIWYHRAGEDGFETAAEVEAEANGWEEVDAVHLTLTVRSRGLNPNNPNFGASSDRERLVRDFSTTIALRNRLGE